MSEFVIGVDLGQTTDPTAIVVLEVGKLGDKPRFDVRHIERILGRPYTAIVSGIEALSAAVGAKGSVRTGFDRTGVGMAVSDMLTKATLVGSLYGITITAGDSVTSEGNNFHVPKRDLVACLQVLFQNGQLRIAKALPLAEVLVSELLNFRVKTTAAANETFEAWRSGDHDDLVLALAIACWLADGRRTETGIIDWYDMKLRERAAAEGTASQPSPKATP